MAFDFGLFNNIFQGTSIGTEGSLIAVLIILAISAIAITRNTHNLRIVLLPLAVGYGRMGFDIHWIVYVVLSISAITAIFGSGIASQLFSINSAAKNIEVRRETTRNYRAMKQEKALLKSIKKAKDAISKKVETNNSQPLETYDTIKKKLEVYK